MILLEHAGILAPDQSRSLLPISFEVPPGLGGIGILLDYHPRSSRRPGVNEPPVHSAVDQQVSDAESSGVTISRTDVRRRILEQPSTRSSIAELRNLINLVLVDADGKQRGRWDLNLEADPRTLVLAEHWAGPGLVPGPIPAGTWTATLEVHQVISESCNYQLRIEGRPESPTPIIEHELSPPTPPPAREEYPSETLPEGWFRGELHCHTRSSDGCFAPEELIERASALGLDFVALTDHNSAAGLAQLDSPALPVIPGCEVTTFFGHFLLLGAGLAPAWYEGQQPISPSRLAELASSEGALFGPAHPFVLGNPICAGCRLEARLAPERIDLVEVWSRGNEEPLATRHALAWLDHLHDQGHHAVAIAGRDWHGPAQEQATSGRRFPATVVRARSARPADLLEGLRRGACYMAVGGIVVDLQLASMDRGAVQIAVEGLEEPAWLRLLSNGSILVEKRVKPGAVRESLRLPAETPRVRLEIWSADLSEPLAITNVVEL